MPLTEHLDSGENSGSEFAAPIELKVSLSPGPASSEQHHDPNYLFNATIAQLLSDITLAERHVAEFRDLQTLHPDHDDFQDSIDNALENLRRAQEQLHRLN
jgi:hypothetical protein